jgi:MFS family permease
MLDRAVWFAQWLVWELPQELVLHQAFRLKRMFRALKGNARIMMPTSFCWALPMNFIAVYLPLYMVECGLSKIAIGTLVSAQMTAQIVGALLGGWLAERWGFRRVLLTFDWLCYILMFAAFATGMGYFPFLAGNIAFGLLSIVMPAWTGLFVAGIPPRDRAYLYAFQQVPWLATGMLLPLGGLLVERLGIVSATRVVFLGGSLTITLGVYLRWRLLKNPFRPVKGGIQPSLAEVGHIVRGHWLALGSLARRRTMLVLFVVQILAMAVITITGTYMNLFLVDARGLRLDPALLSILPMIGAGMMLVVTLLVVPFVTPGGLYGFLILGCGLMLLNVYMLLMSPPRELGVVIGAAMVGACGWGLFNPTYNAAWVNSMGDRERPRILALTGALIMAITMPVPTIAGALYEVHPRGPLYLVAGLLVVMLATLAWAAVKARGRPAIP